MWLWGVLIVCYITILVLFTLVSSPTENSPTTTKLLMDWFIIDYVLIIVMALWYFFKKNELRPKANAHTKAAIMEKFRFYLE
jgi:ABC-type nickel/cobalt efflux system permease component RcnA